MLWVKRDVSRGDCQRSPKQLFLTIDLSTLLPAGLVQLPPDIICVRLPNTVFLYNFAVFELSFVVFHTFYLPRLSSNAWCKFSIENVFEVQNKHEKYTLFTSRMFAILFNVINYTVKVSTNCTTRGACT